MKLTEEQNLSLPLSSKLKTPKAIKAALQSAAFFILKSKTLSVYNITICKVFRIN